MITTTMRMVDGVHGNTASTRPVVSLGLVFVVGTASLKQWLVNPSTTSDDADGRARTAADGLLGTAGEPYPSLVLVRRVANDGSVIAGGTCERATVADLLLDVTDNGTFGALRYRENVADGEGGLFAAVDEGTRVHALGSDEGLFAKFVAVGITEDDTGEGSTTAWVMDDLFHNSPDIAFAFGEVEGAQPGWVFVVMDMRLKDGV